MAPGAPIRNRFTAVYDSHWPRIGASRLHRRCIGSRHQTSPGCQVFLKISKLLSEADIARLTALGRELRFVNDPGAYEGGELSIVVGNQAIAFKGSAGEAIVYPSTALHEVVPVRSGQRLVSITFIESFVPDQHQRTQIYELNEIAALEGLAMKWESRVRLDVVRQNLLRMWSTT